jgi:hypothetical protein
MTDKNKKIQEAPRSEVLEKEVQKEADALWESGVLDADAIEQIGIEHWRTPYPKNSEHFGEAFSDGRLTEQSSTERHFRLREAIVYSKSLGRPLTKQEMKLFEI